MAYTVPEDARAQERLRHRHLAELGAPDAERLFDDIGVGIGWHCVDIGTGGGSLAQALSERVGPSGSVLATDVDLSLVDEYLSERPDNVVIQRHDIIADAPLPERHFDFVHARAMLQHLPDPTEGLSRMVAATRPGGWVAAQDSEWSLFDRQAMPEPFGEFMRQMRQLTESGMNDHQRDLGQRLLRMFIDAGLEDIEVSGRFWQMRGGQPSCEWLMLALEWAVPGLAESGAIDGDVAQRAIAQAREPGFTVMSPTRVLVRGRVPR